MTISNDVVISMIGLLVGCCIGWALYEVVTALWRGQK